MKHITASFLSLFIVGCGPGKADGDSSGAGSDTTSEVDVSWALGEFFGGTGKVTAAKGILVMSENRTAHLQTEFCGIDGLTDQGTLLWEVVSDSEIAFRSAGNEPLEWFGSDIGAVSMINDQENPALVQIVAEKIMTGSTIGTFVKGTGCFFETEPDLGCDGVLIQSCP